MKKTWISLSALGLSLLAAFPAHATVNPKIVSADAKWLIYADLNALRDGAIGKELIALAEKQQFDTGNGKVGLDWQKLLTTIGSATAYGAKLGNKPQDIDGTLVIQGTPELRKIAEGLVLQFQLAHPDAVAELTDLPFPAYALKSQPPKKPTASKESGDTKGDAKAEAPLRELAKAAPAQSSEPTEVIIAFPKEPIVIISKSKAQLVKARDTFTGAAPSLAKAADSALAKFVAASEGAYLFAASTVPAEKFFPEDAAQARILKMTNAGAIAIGERGDNTFLHSELSASTDAMAEKLMKILEGLTAMMSLAETNDRQLADFLNSANVARHGDVVTLDLAYSSARLATMIKNFQSPTGSGMPPRAVAATMINGRALAEWTATPGAAPAEGAPLPLTVRTIENAALRNGALITLARQSNGGKSVRFDRIEILSAGGGAPLVFRPGYMRSGGPRNNWSMFEFPGEDGTYTLRVSYTNDPDGKATFAVSSRDPKASEADTPAAPASKK